MLATLVAKNGVRMENGLMKVTAIKIFVVPKMYLAGLHARVV
jgi:hypothetical protein